MDMLIVHAYVHVCMQSESELAQWGSGLPCSSTSGLYIKPLINPEWRPGSDRMAGQAPVQDRAWFITTELQPALIYFRLRKGESRGGVFKGIGGGHRNGTVTLERETLRLSVTEKGVQPTDWEWSEVESLVLRGFVLKASFAYCRMR